MTRDDRAIVRTAYARTAPPVLMQAPPRLADMMATRFDKQLEFIRDPSRQKAGLCTRRAGKTELVPAYCYDSGYSNPGCVVAYVAPTLKRARELMWKPLKTFNRFFGFGLTPNESLLTIPLPNDAEIRLMGADKIDSADKKRGDKVALVIIDEGSVYRAEVLKMLVDDVFGPALEDVQGTMCLLGTPGIVCAGKWYDISRPVASEREPGWRMFAWSVLDNPHMAHMKARLPEILRDKFNNDPSHPTYQREWLGKWVNDTGALYYRFEEGLNTYDELPSGHAWQYIQGVDLGFDDAFARHVWAFAKTCPYLYEVFSFKSSHLYPEQWRDQIKSGIDAFGPIATVVDTGGLGKAFVEEAVYRFKLPLKAAEKKDKLAYVELMNGDLSSGRIKLKRNSETAKELAVLPKDPDDPTIEDSRFPNHCSDAALYAWREAKHWIGEWPKDEAPIGSMEWMAKEADRKERELEARLSSRSNPGEFEGMGYEFDT